MASCSDLLLLSYCYVSLLCSHAGKLQAEFKSLSGTTRTMAANSQSQDIYYILLILLSFSAEASNSLAISATGRRCERA